MTHIVIDARELRTTSGRYVERLLHYLQQIDKGYDYTILLTPKDFDGWAPTNERFTKVVTPYKEFTFGEQLGFKRQLELLKPDLVFFPMVHQPVLYRGNVVTTIQDLTGIRFRNPTKNPVIFTVKQLIYKGINKYIPRKSRLLITPTEFVKQDIMQYAHIPADKITVTLEAADFIHSSPTAPKTINLQNSKFIMYVGRPQPHKNLWRLIEAYALLRPSHPDLKLVLAGRKDAMYNHIETKAKAAGIAEGIIFTDYITDAELRWLYQNTQAYIFPSLSEGFGLPGLEAMMHGAPVVSSNATCLPEVHGDAAHYFNPLDPADMAQKIAEVIDDPGFRNELVKRGKVQSAKFSWKRMAEQTLDVFKRALGDA
jgi:glycosyltransferase involved in cell wall biosynthesis